MTTMFASLDDTPLLFDPTMSSWIYNDVLGTSSILLLGLLFILKLILPWNHTPYITRFVMAYISVRITITTPKRASRTPHFRHF